MCHKVYSIYHHVNPNWNSPIKFVISLQMEFCSIPAEAAHLCTSGSTAASITQVLLCEVTSKSNKPPPFQNEHLKRDKKWACQKRTRTSNILVIQAMFSLPQQIYTVVSDGLGVLLKHSPQIINREQLTPSDTCTSLPDTAWLFWGGGIEGYIPGSLNVAMKVHFCTAVLYHHDAHLRDKMSPWKFPTQRKALVQPCDKSHLVIFRCSAQSFWVVGVWGF